MNRRQSLEKGILSPSGFLTPSQSPSIQHSPRLQPSPSQSPFQPQDVLLVTNNNQHFINTFSATQEQDRKTGTPNRRSSLNHISPNANIVYRPSPTQSPAGIVNEINTTLVGSNNISLNKKGKRTPNAGQYGASSSNACSPKAAKKTMALVGSPIASPSASPQPSAVIQQFPMMSGNNSIVFMQQPATSHRASIIQTSNTQQSNFIATSSSSTSNAKHNKAPQQILPKPASSSSSNHPGTASLTSSTLTTQSLITSTSTKQITQSKMAIVQQQQQAQQQFQSPPHQSPHQIITTGSQPGSESSSPQPQQITTQGGSILLPTGAQPLLLNQMPVLVQQNTAQGVQLILRQPPSNQQLAAPSLVIHNRSGQMQQNQHQAGQLVRILNTNGMQLATAATPAFIVSSQANIIQQNLQSIKTPTNNSSQMNQLSGIQQNQQQTSRQHQQIINSHILGQSVAQIQNLQLNGNLTQIQMPNGQILQQLPAQFSQNLGSFNQIQPLGSQIAAINATFQSPPSNSQNDIVPTVVSSTLNPIQFATNQQNSIAMTQGAQIISPGTTPQPQIIQSDQILSSPPSITFNSQPQTAVLVQSSDKQMHEISSPPPFSIIQQSTGNTEMINLDMTHHHVPQPQTTVTKPARKPKKSKKKQALEEQQLQLQLQLQQQQQQHQQQQQQQQQQMQIFSNQSTNIITNDDSSMMLSPNRNNNSQAPTGKLDLANVIKLCGISEDDDFMDTDDQMDQMESQQMEQTQTIQIPSSNNNGDNNNATDIMITIPSSSSDQPPYTLTFPSSSIDNADGSIIHHQNTNSDNNNKVTENVPFMIRFDGDGQSGSQPFTISVPNLNDEMNVEEGKQQDDANANNSNSITCVPSFVNSVLSSSVTPTIQSQINEIQNQLMALPPVTSTVTAKTTNVKAPRQKKQTTKKSKKQQEKTIEVPTQIGNIQISQIDGNTMKNTIGSKNINNQIQIMPILEKNSHSTSGQIMEKQKFQIPIMQQTISHQDNNHQDNKQHHHHQQQQQHNSQGPPPNNSGPSQVNINVQQNQLINVTNNLQMQVIANPQQQHHHHHHHSNATPAPPPQSSSSHQNISHNASITTQSAINAQNIIGNLINAQQGQGGGNIIIQGASSFNQQQPANIQVNIQNQTIANNIITTAPQSVTQNITTNTQQQQQQPTAQSILSQLTGNLVLSLSEDGRLILHHDPNIPQDEQSQKILEIVLTGALGNVSLINEPLKTPAQNQQQTQHHIIGANGKIQQVSTVQNKNVIITNQTQPQQPQQQIFNNMVQTQAVPSGQIIQNTSQPIQIQQSRIVDNSQQQKPQAVVLPTPNIIKFVELPKIQPNQQLFSLNTITNEITLLNPNQTTAALSPMERLLIVPSGINAQQLAQCLSQGQIHFNNIGQAPTTDPNKVQQQQLQIQQQIQLQQQQMTFKTTKVQNINQTIKKEPAETKPKKGRGKKAKLLEEQMKEIKKEPIQSPPPMKMITTQAQVAIMDTKVIKTTTVMTSSVTTTTNSGSKNTITISPNPTMIVNPTKANITKTTVQANVNATKANKNSITVIPTSTLLPNNVTTAAATKIVKGNKNQQIKQSITTQLSPIITSNQQQQQQTPPPPLVSVNQAPIPRVQTIQLTPQKQQSLKNVQMQIQQLSAKLQNKNLLSTLTSDIDLNNPAFQKPLPALVNINSMSDNEIYEALQRLFIEQQKILATGKIIPTIPAVSPVTGGNQTTIRTMQNPSQSLFVNNQNIVAPISTSTSSGASLYSGGNSQKVPSPVQVNSPIVKQESPCSTSTSSQPPPLVVSTPIQMQIKTEILPSPIITAPVPTPMPIIPCANPPATGSIVISPKYTTSNVKITIDPQTQKEQKVPVDSKIDIVPVQSNDIAIEPSAIIKQQQIAAVELNQKKKLTRSSLFERQICVDQEGCTNPDVKSDFSSKEDAVKRLIRYHCLYEEIKDENDPKEEFEFGEQSKLFLASFQAMKEKYQHLLLRQSQQQAPTSELMMLDRLQVADLKDEIVSMQMEINSALFEQQQQQQQQSESQITIKTEPICQSTISKPQSSVQHMQNSNLQTQSPGQQQQAHIINPPPSQRAHFVPSLHEPSQILKAKQEQKLFENIKNERIKIEIPEIPKDNSRKSFGMMVNNSSVQSTSIPSPKSPVSSSISPSSTTNLQQKGLSKFDKLKNEQININQHNAQPLQQTQQSPQQQQTTLKLINELKDELDDFDIESEIRSNFIMKKCEPNAQQSSSTTSSTNNKKTSKSLTKEKEKERECSPFSDYLNSVKMELIPSKNKINEVIKTETHDGAYDEWLSIQKELNLHLDASCSNTTNAKRKETSGSNKNLKIQSTKALESDLSDIFENHNSPKSVEKQLDDLFSSTSKSNDLLDASSPPELNELFHVESTSTMSEKTVENRLEALFGGPEDDSVKSSQQDLVETRLEQLFQSGSVNPNDESALDNASFLYKNSDLTYDEMIQKQIQVTTSRMEPVVANTSNANKRQWNANSCDIFASSNSGMIFPTSPTTSKRTCTEPSVSFDNKWIDDSFDFGSDINLTSESTSDDMAKHREWNGLDHDMDENQYQIQNNDSSNLHSNHNIQQQQQHLNSIIEQQQQQQQQQASGDVDHMMDTSQMPQINFVDDVDDISRQVQNAIDSILNLQNSDPLHYQLDSSFLELNSITSSSPNSPVSNHQQASTHNITQQNQHHNQYQLHHQDHHLTSNAFSNSTSQKNSSNIPKRKYSRMDDIGDCLIGGSNLDDSPSALSLTLTDSHNDTSSANSVGEFVTNLLNCDEKSITTS